MADEKKYKHDFLTNVIFKVDFPQRLDINAQTPPAEFQRRIQDKFPHVKEAVAHAFELTAGNQNDISFKQQGVKFWEFYNREKNVKVLVSANDVSIECINYKGFHQLSEDINTIFTTFFELYPSQIIKRIGLRYINEIKLDSGDPLDWNSLINNELLTPFSNFVDENDKCNLIRSLNLLELKTEEYNLKFQNGVYNSEYPNNITRKEFVLDYDCYTVEELDVSDINKKANDFHKVIKYWFERSILNGLRKIMEGSPSEP